ncbi:hypothetical protein ACFP1I_09075 [Dyadobacter subterraneus]|uniref:Uncharacterized protein n=1 Tax=Dyadobacter subterraneus TaxID=2773304 RepID=A0ABR9WB85_9BACT|nr:hypothetical protein [Dyadobacter subterraneus]MBE9462746.1 hypothetical protein [Dyadobacter subterraneus]
MKKAEAIRSSPTINLKSREDIIISYLTIYVFKTNVKEFGDAQIIAKILLSHFPGSEISFDLGDCDKVLRIKHHGNFASQAIEIVKQHGFNCEELLD